MRKLIVTVLSSLDGFAADASLTLLDARRVEDSQLVALRYAVG